MRTLLHINPQIKSGFKALALLLLLLGNIGLKAQVASTANYTFSTGTNASLNTDLNSNPVDLSTQPDLMVPGLSTTLATMDIGFDFWFMGTRYFQLTPATRGVVGLGPISPSNGVVNLNQVVANSAPILAPFWNNNTFSPATGRNLRTKLVGNAPNRCFVFEWRLMSNTAYFGAGDMIFQMRLYETTGTIEYVYGNMSITTGSSSATIVTQAAIGFTTNRNLNNTLACVNNLTNYTNTTNPISVNNAVVSQQRSGPIAGLTAGRYFRYTPTVTTAPTNLTFSGVTSNSTTLNWTDNSTNELGFAIYRSDDGGTSYNYVTLVPQNVTTFTQSLLNPGVNYLYRIQAVSEGGVSSTLTGNQTTTASTVISSTTAGGAWSAASTWTGGIVPSLNDNVVIIDGSTVTIDVLSAKCNNLNVGQGNTGILRYSNNAPAALFANGNVTVDAGGIFEVGTSNIQTHALTVGGFNNNGSSGNLTVYGTLDLNNATSPNSGAGVIVTFGGQGNGAIAGTSTTSDFYAIVVNKGIYPNPLQNPILEVNIPITINAPTNSTNRLIINSGTFKLNSASTLTPYNGSQTICSAGGRLWLNNASCSVTQNYVGTFVGAGSPTVFGELRIDNGAFAYGSGNNTMTFSTSAVVYNGISTAFGSRLVMNGGTLTMFGSLQFASSTAVFLTMSAGNIIVDPQSANILASTTTALSIGASTSVNWTGGTMTVVDPPSAQTTTATVIFGSGGQKIVTGGTLKIGDGTSALSSGPLANNTGFLVQLSTPIWNLELANRVDLNTTRICRLVSGVNTILNNVTINTGGHLMLSSAGTSATLALYGDLINNGTLAGVEPNANGTNGVLQFYDSTGTQTVTGSGNFNNIAQLTLAPVLSFINSSNNVVFSQTNNMVVNTVVLATGTLTHNGKLVIGRPGIIPIVQLGGNGQTVPAGSFASIPTFDNTSYPTQYNYGLSSTAYVLGGLNEIGVNTSVIYNLTLNSHTGLTLNRNLNVINNITMTLGNISINNFNLTLGSGLSNIGTLTYTSGNIICGANGRFTRWYNTTATPTTQTAASQFPVGGLTDVRHLWIYANVSTAFSGAGTISVRHNNQSGLNSMTSYTENSVNMDTRTNASWNISVGNGLTLGTGTLSMVARGDGAMIGLVNASNITLTDASGVPFSGTFGAGSGTVTNNIVMQPQALRTAIPSIAAITANPIYLGSPSAAVQSAVSAIASGQWNNPNVWSNGVVPIASTNVIIPLGITLSIDSATACFANILAIQSGGTLNSSGNTLTVSRNLYMNSLAAGNLEIYSRLNLSGGTINILGDATAGGLVTTGLCMLNISGGTLNISNGSDCSKAFTLNSNGILNLSGGTINVYGNITFTGITNQSAGNINVFPLGPIGGPYTALASAPLHSFASANAASQYNGGTITVVDPPFNAAHSIHIGTSGNNVFTGTHTFVLGDSNSIATNGNPFRAETYYSSVTPINNLIINGGITPNRHTETGTNNSTAYGLHVKGNFIINPNSEFRHANLNVVQIGGSLINNGTLTQSSTTPLSLGITTTALPLGNVNVSGTGIFRNATSSPTGSFTTLTIATGNAALRAIINVNNLSVTGTLSLTTGQLDIGANTFILGNTVTPTAGNLIYTAGVQILTNGGSFTRMFGASQALNTAVSTGSIGHYPFGRFNVLNNTVERRDAFVYSGNSAILSTGGSISITPTYVAGSSSVTPFNDGTLFNVDTRTNSYITVNNNGIGLSVGNIAIRLLGENAGIATTSSNTNNTTLMLATGVATGTLSPGTNFLANINAPDFNRIGLTIADISNISYYGGTIGALNIGGNIISVANGDWNNPSTWSSNSVPSATDNVQIIAPYTVAVNANSTNTCNNLNITSGATLVANKNVLNIIGQLNNFGTVLIGGSTVNINTANAALIGINNLVGGTITLNSGTLNIGPSGGGAANLNNVGTLAINAGTLNLNGNLGHSGALFSMLSGNFNIDGNSGTASGSVFPGNALVNLTGAQSITGGTITIVDPPFSGNGLSLINTAVTTAWSNNILRFGDGVSTHPSSAAFTVTTPASIQTAGFGIATSTNLGNVVVNGNGTNRWTTIDGNTLLATSLTINNSCEFRSTANSGPGSVLNLSGNLINNGTLTSAINNTIRFSGTVQQNVSGSGIFRVDTLGAIGSNINNLDIANSSATGVMFNIGNVTIGGNATLSGTLTLSGAGPLNIGANILTLGTSATLTGTLGLATGTIVHTSGGGFRRWYSATVPPTTAVIGAQFPLGILVNGTVLRRDLFVYSSTTPLTTGGTFTATHTLLSGTSSLTPFTDGTVTGIDTRSNSYWNISNTGITSAGTWSVSAVAAGIIFPTTLAQTTLTSSTGALAGTAGVTGGSQSSPTLLRTAMPLATLTSTPGLYVGAASINYNGNIFSVATGGWSKASTWSTGTVPTATDNVTINANHIITLDSIGSARDLTINGFGTLLVNANTLTVNNVLTTASPGNLTINGGTVNVLASSAIPGNGFNNSGNTNLLSGTLSISQPTQNNRTLFHAAGTFNVAGGNLIINGNLIIAGTWQQSGGTITIDGNNGTAAGSVPSANNLVNITGVTHNVTGGTMVIVDPPFGAIGLAFNYAASSNINWINHTLQFGDGTSTTPSGAIAAVNAVNANLGFGVSTTTATATGRLTLHNVIINGGGAGRHVAVATATTNSLDIGNNLTINANSELRTIGAATALTGGVNVGGNITNNGRLVIGSNTTLGFRLSGTVQSYNAQNIGGTGLYLNDTLATCHPCLSNIAVFNYSQQGINLSSLSSPITINQPLGTIGSTLSYGGTIASYLNLGSKNLVLGSTGKALTLTGTFTGNANLILTTGTITRWFNTATAISGNIGLFPIGIPNSPVNFNRTFSFTSTVNPTAAGSISVSATDAAGTTTVTPFIDGTSIVNRRSNSYWTVGISGLTAGGSNFLNYSAQGSGFTTAGISNILDLKVVGATAAAAGLAGTNTGTILDPILSRTGLSELTLPGTYYIGSNNTNNPLDNAPITNNIISGASSVCPGASYGNIIGSLPSTSGSGSISYSWLVSTNGANGTYSAASGTNTQQNYTAGVLGSDSWFKRVVNAGSLSDTSNVLAILVSGISNNIITSSTQSICNGATPKALTASTPIGGSGTYTYTWLRSTTSAAAGYTVAPGVSNTINYIPSALTQNTWYKRVVAANCVDTSAAYSITVSPTPYITSNTVTATSLVCNGASTTINGSNPNGGTGTFSYVWEVSTTSNNAGFGAGSGNNTSANYNASNITSNSWFRRIVNSGVCTDTSSVIAVAQTGTALTNNSVASNQIICAGSIPSAFTGTLPLGGVPSTTRFTEEFNGGTLSPNFSITSNSGTLLVASSAVNSYGRVGTNGALYANNYNVTAGNRGTLDSRTIGATIVGDSLRFDYAYRPYGTPPTASTYTDSLIIWTNNGSGYTRYIGWGPSYDSNIDTINGISTTTGVVGSFTPAATNWAKKVLALPIGTTQIRFEFYSGYGAQLYVDRIVVDSIIPINYTWQSSITSSSAGFNNLTASNNQNYTASAINQNTWFRRIVSSGVCVDTSSTLSVSTTQAISNNSITSGNQTICGGGTPATINATTPLGGNGSTYTYQWLRSTIGATAGFSPIALATSQNYSSGSLTQSTWFKRMVTSGLCAGDTSAAVKINVDSLIANNTISTAQTICSGNTPAALTGSAPAGGNGTSYSYQWLRSTTNATTGYTAIALATTQNYAPGALTANTWYKRLVTSGACASDTSAAVAITVNPVIANNTIGSNQSILSGASPAALTGSLPAGGNNTYTYQWLISTTSATAGFSNIALATSQNYSPGALTVNTWYKRVVNSGTCTDTTAAVAITVNNAISGNTITASQTICSGSAPAQLTGTTPTGGTGVYTYSWLSSTTSATTGFSAIASTNTANYTPSTLTQNTWFRRYVTSGPATDTSAAIAITINTVISNNTISTAQTICAGNTPAALAGSAPAGGNGTSYSYQWLSSTTSATAGFSAIALATTQNYAPSALTNSTWYKRRITSGACASDTSAAVAITVNPVITNNTIGSNQSIVSGASPAALTGSLPAGGNNTYTYQWLISTTSATAGFSNIALAISQNYSPGALTVNTWYKRVVNSGTCTDTTAAVAITVNNAISGNTITASQTICSGSAPAQLTGTTPTGGTGVYTYSWLSSTTSATTGFSAIASTNTANYTPSTLTQNTWFRRYVTSGPATDTSAAIAITINTVISNNTISTAQTICAGNTPAALTGSAPAGGNGTSYSYQWLSSTTSATAGFSAIALATTQNYAPSALTNSTWYKRRITSGACASDTSAAVAITVGTPGTWTGATSTAWNNTANWSCPAIPTSSTNVTIPTGVVNMPIISDGQQANNLTIQSGAVLTLNNAASKLSVFGNITNSGTFTNSNGMVEFSGTVAQIIPNGTYAKLRVNNSAGLSLAGATSITDSLILAAGVVNLGAFNLTLGNASYTSTGSLSSYIKNNGSGNLVVNNIGTSGKTGSILIPIGNSTYNPVTITNTGTADNYTVRVVDSITSSYIGLTPTGSSITAGVVNRTWFINEAVAGGSIASITMQWNASNELTGFNRANAYIASHNGTTWQASTASAAAGSNPYTLVRSGITAFTPFGVGSGSALPVNLIHFDAEKVNETVQLNWTTASELNNNYFEIERSGDGIEFQSTSLIVKGNGTTSAKHHYQVTDKYAAEFAKQVGGTIYYRLKQVDFDGKVTKYDAVPVTFDVTLSDVSSMALPNPFKDELLAQVNLVVAGNVTITLMDVTGKLINTMQVLVNYGANTIQITHIENLQAGVYFVQITAGDKTMTHKVVRQ